MRRCFPRVIFVLAGVALLLQVSQVNAADDLTKDMVHLDQVYIPALAFTSEEKIAPSREAMKSLKQVWTSFKARYQENTHGDTQWKSDFDKVDSFIRAADKIVTNGKNIKDAHEELEQVRIVFMHLRERNHIEYFIDYLTRFHEPMEEIVLAAKNKNETTLSEKDIDLIRHVLPMAKELWRSTSDAKFDALTYEFNNTQAANLHSLVEKETRSLNRLEKALVNGNKKEIAEAAVSIKPNFAKIFKSFGKFPDQ